MRKCPELSAPPARKVRALPGQDGEEDFEVHRESGHASGVAQLRLSREPPPPDVQEDRWRSEHLPRRRTHLHGRVRRPRRLLFLWETRCEHAERRAVKGAVRVFVLAEPAQDEAGARTLSPPRSARF